MTTKIETEVENEEALEIAWPLMKKGLARSHRETADLNQLITLIEEFEEKAYPMGTRHTAFDTYRICLTTDS